MLPAYKLSSAQVRTLITVLAVSTLALCVNHAIANETSTQVDAYAYRTPGSSADHRLSYEVELLRLALDKTVATFGPYTLQPAKAMNLPRTMVTARSSKEALIFKTSYSQTLTQEFRYPTYPIDRGIFSYRICFVNNQIKDKVSQVDNLDDLRRFIIGQGVGWLDVDILEHNGFSVRESSGYEQLFPMLAAGRLDLVCRAQNEVPAEWEIFSHLGGFSIDQSFALFYPLPRFFWVHKSQPRAFERLNLGLKISYQDGSALNLWKQHYQANLRKASLKNRRLYILRNPYLDGISPEYKQYFLDQRTKMCESNC
ncbi:hypothetical protein QWI17_18385 [Gilvimarinus sp. SDUM040013]|uniref:Solute-binding protein family 3/N-terminal domain-containing protein n=1 Tax=Gilvimarinus gilvus TaxID=3058038 RepID=A0ABU4S1H9_9GAMM|nr:hypothetical protein [Gilvimarinus sp. SDUM040013]MDO3387818.1 hypothetical protein [Gilvimarinus sp. SDUM040013]MDX6851039.1 hypothetical protein [Gilvimarinus sp. SDUM040013]